MRYRKKYRYKEKFSLEAFNQKFGLIPAIILANAVFFALYRHFILGNGVYLYTDIGSDSITSSLPILTMLQRLFRDRTFFGYTLSFGLGGDTTSLMMKYLNPMKTPLLFFSGEQLPIGLMVEMAIQTNVIAIFSFLFFKMLLNHGTAALFASLAWTFCGYITLWSQNLTIGSCMAMFTVVMAAMLPAIKKPSFRRNLLLALALGLSLLTNYYFTYMTGIFAIVFLIFFSFSEGYTFGEFLVKGLEIAGAAVFSVGLAAIGIFPSISGFTSSVRTGDLASGSTELSLLSTRGIITMIGRLFSVNTFGVGNSYKGVFNYYEAAVLSTSVLIVFALVYLLIVESTRVMTFLAIVLSCAVLYIRNCGSFIQFNSGVQRFSFMIAFAACIGEGIFIKMLMDKTDRIALRASCIISVILTGGFFVFLWKKGDQYRFTVDIRTLKILSCITIGFALLLFLYSLKAKFFKKAIYLCLMLLCAELVLMNKDTLYQRGFVDRADLTAALDDYGIGTAASDTKMLSDSLYRISGGKETDYANSGMLTGFAGTSVYSNTNPAALMNLEQTMGACQISQNHFIATDSEFGLLSFLTGKYVVKNNTDRSTDTPTSVFYKKTGESSDGSKVIYENTAALPFGYLYQNQVPASDVLNLNLPERIALLSKAYFLTDGISADETGSTDAENTPSAFGSSIETDIYETEHLLNSGRDAHDVKLRKTSSGIIFKPTGGDPFVYYDIGKSEPGTLRMLYLKLNSTAFRGTRQMQLYFMSEGDQDPDGLDYRIFAIADGFPEVSLIIPDDVTTIRLDFPQDRTETNVAKIDLLTSTAAGTLFDDLQSTDISDVSMDRGTYRSVLNSENGGMLCVPLLYSKNWTASVNGKKTAVSNINGGLVGIRVEGGTEDIVLQYNFIPYYIFAVISLLFLIASIAMMIHPPKIRKDSN